MESPKLEVGMHLATNNGQIRTNAIIVNITPQGITVLSDFGNLIKCKESSILLSMYSISDSWLENRHFGYPFQSIFERIDEQISNLTRAREELLNE